ncbi:hypothetical protein FOZ60_001298 [Perkinsus olseni]|uniref:Uncharacterized protein n=1 Tax=Perkinsus olseni TaxID=32597 RepID=A0A7J6MSF6_PEROL|nr:hypothetical protein FOZ60_001298 [Perkinsus olseni]
MHSRHATIQWNSTKWRNRRRRRYRRLLHSRLHNSPGVAPPRFSTVGDETARRRSSYLSVRLRTSPCEPSWNAYGDEAEMPLHISHCLVSPDLDQWILALASSAASLDIWPMLPRHRRRVQIGPPWQGRTWTAALDE